MELKYDIYMLNNAQGTGEKRQYIRIVQHEPMTEKQLQEKIQSRCSLTKGDVAAVLAELHDLMVEEFSLGRRFYIPEIGYFSMSASLEMPEENPDKKITGKEVRITGINFRPEGKLMEEVQRNVHFVRSRYSNQSTKYSEEKMLENIKEYLQKNRYITTRILRILFGLTPYMAQPFLRERHHGEGRHPACSYLFLEVKGGRNSIFQFNHHYYDKGRADRQNQRHRMGGLRG